ncbi:MAG: hypothetical protein KAJ19_13545, partial [Gammaproteobacteria bacterium]|nr:hypothetical protein [Gammaproteobacteria bacterium]
MSWAQLLASGSGQVNFRLQIEGFPYEAVTSRAMEVTSTDGRIRYAGLDSSRFSLAERVDLVLAHWEPEGFRVQLVDRNRQWTEAFRIPTAVTYMDAIMTSAAGIATVKATGAFASAGQIYTDTETINYAALNTAGTAFQSVVRGKWESLEQTHYTVDGERARRPEVTNWPRVREGRRVALYAYGAGDALADTSPTAGTKIWTGVVSTEPQFDGMSWSFSIDPITRKWDADVGGDLEDPTDIRGIYYPAQSPLVVKVVEHADIGRNSAVQASTIFMMAGFWETQRDFLIALNAQLDSAAQLSTPLEGTFTQEVEAVERGDTWALQYTTASTPDEKFMSLYATSAVDRIWMASGVWQNYEVSSGFSGNSVGPDNRYEQRQVSSDFGRVPRAAIGRGPGVDWGGWTIGTRAVDISDVTFPSTRVYIGGITAVTATTAAAAFEWESNGNPNPDEGLGELFSCDVIVVNTANRYIELDNVRPLRSVGGGNRHYSASGSGIVSIRLGRKYGAGHLGDFITALTADVPDFLNTGAVPDVRASDFVSTGGGISIASTGIPGAAAGNPLANNRGYTVFSPVSFAEMVEHECRLLGVFPAYNANGE